MSQVPTTYSFDAPTDFINFSSLDAEEDTENIDSWFGKWHLLFCLFWFGFCFCFYVSVLDLSVNKVAVNENHS